MLRKAVYLAALLLQFNSLARADDCAHMLCLTELHSRHVINSDGQSNLSPALLATKDGGGILKGADNTGKPVIAIPRDNMEKFRASRAVRSWSTDIAQDSWKPVSRLKLSYKDNDRPTEEELKAMGLKLIEDYRKGTFMIVEPGDKLINARLAEKLERNSKIMYATPSFKIKAIQPALRGDYQDKKDSSVPDDQPTNDPLWPKLWGMPNIRAPAAWKSVKTSPIIVAVIDTGVDYEHEDLMCNMWEDADGRHGFDFLTNDAFPKDKNGHGTHCAGIIGAVGNNKKGVVGVNWNIKIIAVRWLDSSGDGEVGDAIKGIDYAIEHEAKVLSISWMWPEDDPDLQYAIKRGAEKNVVFVVAASNYRRRPHNNDGDNDKLDTFGRYPSAYRLDNIIAVSAIDEQEKLWPKSNYGRRTVHLGAPGDKIWSTIPDNKYCGTYSGTSMSAPYVAGAVALTLAHPDYRTASPKEVRDLFIKHARAVDDLKARCVSGGTLDLSFLANRKAIK